MSSRGAGKGSSELANLAQVSELLGCVGLLNRLLNAYLTEVEYEGDLGQYNPASVAQIRSRTDFLAELVIEEYGELLERVSFPGEVERWRAWLKRAFATKSLRDQEDQDPYFPVDRPIAEARWQVRLWRERLRKLVTGEEIVAHHEAPVCFVSYCSQPEDNSRWVRLLATSLQGKGVRVVIDLWDLMPGQDLRLFMEGAINSADSVLVICTPEYKNKADTGLGGAGRESTIISLNMYQDVRKKRVIPVLRGNRRESWPTYLGETVYVDFRNESAYDSKVNELVKAIFRIPRYERPPLGSSPFAYPD